MTSDLTDGLTDGPVEHTLMTATPGSIPASIQAGMRTVSTADSIAEGTSPVTSFPSVTGAKARLAKRVLVVAGSREQHVYPALIAAEATALDTTGLVVCGSDWSSTIRRIRVAHPDLFLLCDPQESEKFMASEDDPFPQETGGADTLFSPPTLDERLQAQIDAGASLAVTPTGYIQAGDRLALRAVVTAVNQIRRDDTVLLLPLDHKWLVGADLKLVLTAVTRSKHPVAITLGDSSGDPLSHMGVLEGARTLAALPDPPMFHKSDLAGFDLLAHGSLAASIGAIASKRRATIPGKVPFAPRTNRGATVHLPELLRFRRTLDMQEQWYASITPPDCFCGACQGQPIDRFGTDEYDSVSATRHNAAGIIGYINSAVAAGGFANFWPGKVDDAIAAHVTLSARVGTQIDPPREVIAWRRTADGTRDH